MHLAAAIFLFAFWAGMVAGQLWAKKEADNCDTWHCPHGYSDELDCAVCGH